MGFTCVVRQPAHTYCGGALKKKMEKLWTPLLYHETMWHFKRKERPDRVHMLRHGIHILQLVLIYDFLLKHDTRWNKKKKHKRQRERERICVKWIWTSDAWHDLDITLMLIVSDFPASLHEASLCSYIRRQLGSTLNNEDFLGERSVNWRDIIKLVITQTFSKGMCSKLDTDAES